MTPTKAIDETFSPWSVVHLVFTHLVEHGLHPQLGEGGDPSLPAAALLEALGVRSERAQDGRLARSRAEELSQLRGALLGEPARGDEPPVSS